MATTDTPNMELPLPTVGQESGPQYAFDINAALTLVDSHDHTPGKGVQITPAGMNINTALNFQDNFATNMGGITFLAQSSAPADGTIYMSGVDLYYIDGNGNNVRMTQSGGVAGTPGSIAGLTSPASATYVSASKTFVWQSNAGIAANLDAASLVMRNISPNSTYALTLQPPAALGSNYSLTLPTIPSNTSFVTIDTSGNITGSVPTANGITRSNLAAVGQIISSSSGSFSHGGNTSEVNVTNLSVTLHTTGRPVIILITGAGSAPASIAMQGTGSGQFAVLNIRNSGGLIFSTQFLANPSGAATFFPATIMQMDTPTAGTQEYVVSVQNNNTNSTIAVTDCQLVAYEL